MRLPRGRSLFLVICVWIRMYNTSFWQLGWGTPEAGVGHCCKGRVRRSDQSTAGAVMQIPGVKEGVDEKIQQTKESIARKFRKESR